MFKPNQKQPTNQFNESMFAYIHFDKRGKYSTGMYSISELSKFDLFHKWVIHHIGSEQSFSMGARNASKIQK